MNLHVPHVGWHANLQKLQTYHMCRGPQRANVHGSRKRGVGNQGLRQSWLWWTGSARLRYNFLQVLLYIPLAACGQQAFDHYKLDCAGLFFSASALTGTYTNRTAKILTNICFANCCAIW